MEVFISYSTQDVGEAETLTSALEDSGLTIWRDQERLKGGARFSREIELAIRRSDVLVVLISATARESQWVENEILFALDNNKAIVPLMLEPNITLPLPIYGHQYIIMYQSWSSGTQKLIDKLNEVRVVADVEQLERETTYEPKVDSPAGQDVNPFIYGTAVPVNRFIGRHEALNIVRNRIGGATLQSTSIVANRRMGKTSLLNYIRRRLGETLPASERKWAFVYIDMMDERAHSVKAVMRVLRRGIARQTGSEPWSVEHDGQLVWLSEAFEELSDYQGTSLILCIDEWEKVLAFEELDPLLETLRVAGSNGHIAMILATANPLIELAQASRHTSPYYNIFITAYLGRFSEPEWKLLIEQAFEQTGRTISGLEMDLIGTLAGGHPYLTQWAGALLWDAQHNQWDDTEIRQRFYDQARFIFSMLWQRLTAQETHVILQILGLTPPQSIPDQVMRNLELRGVITPERDVFCTPFADFVRNEIAGTTPHEIATSQ